MQTGRAQAKGAWLPPVRIGLESPASHDHDRSGRSDGFRWRKKVNRDRVFAILAPVAGRLLFQPSRLSKCPLRLEGIPCLDFEIDGLGPGAPPIRAGGIMIRALWKGQASCPLLPPVQQGRGPHGWRARPLADSLDHNQGPTLLAWCS